MSNTMNKEQIAAVMNLIRLMDGDEEAQADANAYGNFYQHLVDFAVDVHTETN